MSNKTHYTLDEIRAKGIDEWMIHPNIDAIAVIKTEDGSIYIYDDMSSLYVLVFKAN